MSTIKFTSLLRNPDVLIIVPPFASIERPSLAAHVLQACAGKTGIRVGVLYANIFFASIIGKKIYQSISCMPIGQIGERVFAASAYGVPALGSRAAEMLNFEFFKVPSQSKFKMNDTERTQFIKKTGSVKYFDIKLSELEQLETKVNPWLDKVAAAVVNCKPRVVGCTTSFQQTSSSVTLLNRIKQLCPQIISIIGGANCEGEMAEGIASLSTAIDYVFSGESESSFLSFLSGVFSDNPPANRIIYGSPCQELDAIPTPDFAEFFKQAECFSSDNNNGPPRLELLYESSRGCWWGEKHQCTFCGLNGSGIKYREKSPEKVISELKEILTKSPTKSVRMTDNIMPHTYFRTLLPQFKTEIPGIQIFYEQKANLKLADIITLKESGVLWIQPGIEALSSSLLKRMHKGVSARQNIALLRYARSVELPLTWQLLWGFPGDRLYEYEQTLDLLPLLRHLQPPENLLHLVIERYSPYFEHPDDYGLKNIRPFGGYNLVLPETVDSGKVAYQFAADYQCASHENLDVIFKIYREIKAWKHVWRPRVIPPWNFTLRIKPVLEVNRDSEERFILRDTRALPETQESLTINREQAKAALVAGPFKETEPIEWAIKHKLGVKLDSWYVPLATAEPELLQNFEIEQAKIRK